MESVAEKTDEEVVRQVQRGAVESFGVLMERFEPKLMRYGRRFLSDSDDVRDLVQEVFIKTYTTIKKFDASRRFSPWIYRIAHNEFVNALKKKTERKTLSLFDFDTLFPHPLAKEAADDTLNKEMLKKMLDSCVEKLDPKYREPLVLFYYEDLDYAAIADVLQIPIATVGVRLSRGKAALKKILESSNSL